jgi:hypothetical protein
MEHPSNTVVILGAALAVSEALALVPQLKANGLLHGIIVTLKTLLGK